MQLLLEVLMALVPLLLRSLAFVITTHGGPWWLQLFLSARMVPLQHIFPPPGRLLHPLPPHAPHFLAQHVSPRRMPVLHEGSAFFGLDRVTRALAPVAKERRINICAIAEAFMIISTALASSGAPIRDPPSHTLSPALSPRRSQMK